MVNKYTLATNYTQVGVVIPLPPDAAGLCYPVRTAPWS